MSWNLSVFPVQQHQQHHQQQPIYPILQPWQQPQHIIVSAEKRAMTPKVPQKTHAAARPTLGAKVDLVWLRHALEAFYEVNNPVMVLAVQGVVDEFAKRGADFIELELLNQDLRERYAGKDLSTVRLPAKEAVVPTMSTPLGDYDPNSNSSHVTSTPAHVHTGEHSTARASDTPSTPYTHASYPPSPAPSPAITITTQGDPSKHLQTPSPEGAGWTLAETPASQASFGMGISPLDQMTFQGGQTPNPGNASLQSSRMVATTTAETSRMCVGDSFAGGVMLVGDGEAAYVSSDKHESSSSMVLEVAASVSNGADGVCVWCSVDGEGWQAASGSGVQGACLKLEASSARLIVEIWDQGLNNRVFAMEKNIVDVLAGGNHTIVVSKTHQTLVTDVTVDVMLPSIMGKEGGVLSLRLKSGFGHAAAPRTFDSVLSTFAGHEKGPTEIFQKILHRLRKGVVEGGDPAQLIKGGGDMVDMLQDTIGEQNREIQRLLAMVKSTRVPFSASMSADPSESLDGASEEELRLELEGKRSRYAQVARDKERSRESVWSALRSAQAMLASMELAQTQAGDASVMRRNIDATRQDNNMLIRAPAESEDLEAPNGNQQSRDSWPMVQL